MGSSAIQFRTRQVGGRKFFRCSSWRQASRLECRTLWCGGPRRSGSMGTHGSLSRRATLSPSGMWSSRPPQGDSTCIRDSPSPYHARCYWSYIGTCCPQESRHQASPTKNTTKSPECSIRKHLCHRMGQEDGWVHNEWLCSHSCNGHYHLLRLVIYLKWHIEGICGSGYEYDGNLR